MTSKSTQKWLRKRRDAPALETRAAVSDGRNVSVCPVACGVCGEVPCVDRPHYCTYGFSQQDHERIVQGHHEYRDAMDAYGQNEYRVPYRMREDNREPEECR